MARAGSGLSVKPTGIFYENSVLVQLKTLSREDENPSFLEVQKSKIELEIAQLKDEVRRLKNQCYNITSSDVTESPIASSIRDHQIIRSRKARIAEKRKQSRTGQKLFQTIAVIEENESSLSQHSAQRLAKAKQDVEDLRVSCRKLEDEIRKIRRKIERASLESGNPKAIIEKRKKQIEKAVALHRALKAEYEQYRNEQEHEINGINQLQDQLIQTLKRQQEQSQRLLELERTQKTEIEQAIEKTRRTEHPPVSATTAPVSATTPLVSATTPLVSATTAPVSATTPVATYIEDSGGDTTSICDVDSDSYISSLSNSGSFSESTSIFPLNSDASNSTESFGDTTETLDVDSISGSESTGGEVTTVRAGNFASKPSKRKILPVFVAQGTVVSFVVRQNRDLSFYVLVSYKKCAAAKRAVERLNKTLLNGNIIHVALSAMTSIKRESLRSVDPRNESSVAGGEQSPGVDAFLNADDVMANEIQSPSTPQITRWDYGQSDSLINSV